MEDKPGEYSANLHFNNIDNYSQEYLYTTDEKIDELIKKIGDSEVGPGNAMGHSAEEISSNIMGFDVRELTVVKRNDGTVYKYYWQPTKTHFGSHYQYEFHCDNDGICYYYDLF